MHFVSEQGQITAMTGLLSHRLERFPGAKLGIGQLDTLRNQSEGVLDNTRLLIGEH